MLGKPSKSLMRARYFTLVESIGVLIPFVLLGCGCAKQAKPILPLTKNQIIEAIDLIEPWRSNLHYSEEGWRRLAVLAQMIQNSDPQTVAVALNDYVTMKTEGFHGDHEDASKPFILLRMVFDTTVRTNMADNEVRRFRHWRGVGDTNSAWQKDPYSWPLTWTNNHPQIIAPWMGSFGRMYAADEEYRFFLRNFPYRDINSVRLE